MDKFESVKLKKDNYSRTGKAELWFFCITYLRKDLSTYKV
jgi:hypothetical protein